MLSKSYGGPHVMPGIPEMQGVGRDWIAKEMQGERDPELEGTPIYELEAGKGRSSKVELDGMCK